MQADEDLMRQHYCDLKDRPFFPGLVRFMSSGPVVAMVSPFILFSPECDSRAL
uniref:nucleoside-diphosphate kinase n=1 Tax=Sinocyclocheilus anshuiensis TaxID=1608454 RepID=A0A671MJH3_9TELE